MNKLQLEVNHCRAVCDELRAKLNTCVADTLDREANVIGQEAVELLACNKTTESRYALKIANAMRTRAALARAGGV